MKQQGSRPNRPEAAVRAEGFMYLPLPNVVKRKRSSVRDSESASLRAGWDACEDEFRRQLMRG